MIGARIMPGTPINFSPRIRPSNVSQTGFLMRSPMILLLRKYSNLWMTTRKMSAASAILGEMVKLMPTMMVLLIRLPTTGSRPQKNVMPMTTAAYGSDTARTKIEVSAVLMEEMIICAPITVTKQWYRLRKRWAISSAQTA